MMRKIAWRSALWAGVAAFCWRVSQPCWELGEVAGIEPWLRVMIFGVAAASSANVICLAVTEVDRSMPGGGR